MMHRLVQLHIQFVPSDRSVVSLDRRLLCILLFKDLSILEINYSLFYYSTKKKKKNQTNMKKCNLARLNTVQKAKNKKNFGSEISSHTGKLFKLNRNLSNIK